MARHFRRQPNRAPESTAVAEQYDTQEALADTEALMRHHRRQIKQQTGLGELGLDHRREEANLRVSRPVLMDPGAGMIGDWINRYTQSNFPFTTDGTSQRIIPSNPLRTYLLIQNKSAADMFVNFGQNATTYTGVLIIAGGNYELIGGATGGAHCPADDVYVLGSAAALEGVITEGVMMAASDVQYI